MSSSKPYRKGTKPNQTSLAPIDPSQSYIRLISGVRDMNVVFPIGR